MSEYYSNRYAQKGKGTPNGSNFGVFSDTGTRACRFFRHAFHAEWDWWNRGSRRSVRELPRGTDRCSEHFVFADEACRGRDDDDLDGVQDPKDCQENEADQD